jgi:futalosine hydrolase
MYIIIVAATQFEIAPLLAFLEDNGKKIESTFFHINEIKVKIIYSGIGIMASSIALTQAFQNTSCDFCLQVGIGGAYPHPSLKLGELVYIQSDQLGDLGVYNATGEFLPLQAIDLEEPTALAIKAAIPQQLQVLLKRQKAAKGLTVNAPLGNNQWYKHFGFEENTFVIESMEGAPFHYICSQMNFNFVQIRAISNWVEPRNKANWKMKESIENLNNWLITTLSTLSNNLT